MFKGPAKIPFFPLPLATGLLTAQIVAFFQVRHSNMATCEQVKQITAAGFLPIPLGQAAVGLSHWGSAFWGGLFFTLSIGAGLSIATWVIVNAWRKTFGRSPVFALAAAAIWAALVLWINLDGFTAAGTLYAVLIPAATAATTIADRPRPQANLLWLLAPLLLLTGLWYSQMNNQLFINIRDYLLLSNPAGKAVNDFYYRYTMYPAQSFKSFQQQTVRTCYIEKPASNLGRLQQLLIANDIIPIARKDAAQMRVSLFNRQLDLTSPGGSKVVVSLQEFVRRPRQVIASFSAAADNQARFRTVTFYGLLIGFPVLLYLAVFNFVLRLMQGLGRRGGAQPLAALFCFLLGCALFWPVYTGTRAASRLGSNQLASAIDSDNWYLRISALRQIAATGPDISVFPGYRRIAQKGRIAERYWLAKALGASREPETLQDLYRMLADPHPNVVCQALAALGERKDKAAIAPILAKLTSTDHWYIQYYAYQALRRLGWKQGK